MTTSNENAASQAQAQFESIAEMVAALEVDYDRIEELQSVDSEELEEGGREELIELLEAAGDCESREDAEQRIQEDALSVMVRSGWYAPNGETPKPEYFTILLCTGGPHCELKGELDEYGEPMSASIHYQDWLTTLDQRINNDGDEDILLTYARCFYFGAG